MIRIGDFAKLSRVSVKTLRHYDELGLIKPVRVDEFTGYRYYDYEQYPLMSRIRALQDLGFSLDEIGRLLSAGLTSEQMQAMLRLRRAEIGQRIADEEGRLARLDAWLRQLERTETMAEYDVVIKRIPSIRGASMRGVVPQPPDQNRLWGPLFSYLGAHRVEMSGQCISLYHDEEYQDKDWDIEVFAPINDELPESPEVSVRELPVVEAAACVVYAGPLITMDEAYASLSRWVGENGYRVAGPPREVVVRPPALENGAASQTDPASIIEIQFPVVKA
jgi:DNA-binding transcriptional MerR regulator